MWSFAIRHRVQQGRCLMPFGGVLRCFRTRHLHSSTLLHGACRAVLHTCVRAQLGDPSARRAIHCGHTIGHPHCGPVSEVSEHTQRGGACRPWCTQAAELATCIWELNCGATGREQGTSLVVGCGWWRHAQQSDCVSFRVVCCDVIALPCTSQALFCGSLRVAPLSSSAAPGVFCT